MRKPILYIKVRNIPDKETMERISSKLDGYHLLFMKCGQGELESVKLLKKGRDTKNVTKELKNLIDKYNNAPN